MKFLAPVLVSVAQATISVSLDKLTNFNTKFEIKAGPVHLTPVESFDVTGGGELHLNLFQGKMSGGDHGESTGHVDCETSPYARYEQVCRNPIFKGLAETHKVGAGQFFIDMESGKFGVKGHETGANIHMDDAKYAVNFCAVLDIPPRAHVLPPPAMLRQRLNAQSVKAIEQRLNSMPHTEADGVATFHSPPAYGKREGYAYSEKEFSIHTEGGDPVHAQAKMYAPDHDPYSPGWKGASEPQHIEDSASLDFTEWTSPSEGFASFTCPEGASTDLHAHPEVKRTLATLNAMTSHMRQHEELAWLPENPAELFMAELDKRHQERTTPSAPQDFMGSMVVPLVAGVSGGLVVLAFFQLTKSRKQDVLLSEA